MTPSTERAVIAGLQLKPTQPNGSGTSPKLGSLSEKRHGQRSPTEVVSFYWYKLHSQKYLPQSNCP